MTSNNNSTPAVSDAQPENPLTANIRYGYGLGWSFTPLSGKRPTLKGWQDRPRETLDQATAWAVKGNVGLRTGQNSGIVVIDVDPGADVSHLDLPGTVTAMTGRPGGYHLYFLCDLPVGNSSGKLGPHIDVRGDGGQVVLPGSVHPDTKSVYTWADGHEPWNVEIAALPKRVLDLLTADEKPSRHASPAKSSTLRDVPAKAIKYAQTAMKMELNAVCTAVEGERNETLNKAAFSLGTLIGGGYLDHAEVEQALLAAAGSCGLVSDPNDGLQKTLNTIHSAIDAGVQQPRHIDVKPPPTTTAVGGHADQYVLTPGPHKNDADKYFERSTAEFAADVLNRMPDDTIYRRAFIPGEIAGQHGKRRWAELGTDHMRILVDRHMKLGKWITSRKSEEQVLLYQACSKDNAGLVVAHAQNALGVRDLNLMVPYPIYGPGFMRIEPGWHDGLYYDEPDELRGLEPEVDCEVIHNVLHDLVVDFPFKTDADRQNFFGLLLTPIVAPAIDGNRPMHLLNAPLERTGKSKLVNEVFGGIITGRDTPSMQITEREEEREKRILAMLLQGETLMHLDNLPAFVDSPALASLLTTQWFIGRVLGHSRNASLPNNLTLVGTGNNVQASGEIAKRVVPIMIEPTSSNPEARNDFQHPDIRAYVREHRRVVLECLLGLVENWLSAGRPAHTNRLGGFEIWSETIGGILQINGLRKWRTNEGDWRKSADPRGQEWSVFVETWHVNFGLQEVTVKQLLELARDMELFQFVLAKPTLPAQGAAMGKLLQRNIDAPIRAWFIRRNTTTSGHSTYLLEPVRNTQVEA